MKFISRRTYRWRSIIFLFCIGLLVGLYGLLTFKDFASGKLSKSNNYFLTELEYDKMGYIVNTSECKIPGIQPWNPSITPLTNKIPPIDCSKQMGHWTHVKKSAIVLNQTAIEASGYTVKSLHCCYRGIHRDPSLFNNVTGWYSRVVDSRITYSTTCYPMGITTEPIFEYIFVTCEPKYFHWYFDERLTSKVVYKNFHALIPKVKNVEIEEKIRHWENTSTEIKDSPNNRPPNVVVLGIDASSRLNFRRSMPRTIRILERIGAHEMLGYTKVGENTFPNLVAFLTGYTSGEFGQVCWYERATKLDDCPFIWNRFSEAKYLTAEIQDSPRLNNWNFEKTGFVNPPTTFYPRPLLLGVHLNAGFYPNRVDCIGYQKVEEMLLGYIQDIIEFSHSAKTPLFLMSWLTQLAHDSLNSLQFGDPLFADLLESLEKQGALDNTILIVASDHGFRYGGVRETLSGYYEDKLPNLWIRLPPWIVKRFPDWDRALRKNSRSLSSTFHIYKTLAHILDTFTETAEKEARTLSGAKVTRIYGQSFFKPISENLNCGSAGIPNSYCACNFPISLPRSSLRLREAAEAALNNLNNKLPKQCSSLKLSKVKGGANLSKLGENQNKLRSELIVEFSTSPGDFILEATVVRVRLNSTTDESQYVVQENIQRLSQFNTDLSCMQDPVMQLYCFCL